MPTLEELLATCPPVPPPDPRPILGSYDIRLSWNPTSRLGDVIELEVRPGVLNQPGGGLCAALRARTVDGTAGSAWEEIASDASCVRVPEPDFAVGVLLGLLWVGLILGAARRLRTVGRNYPPAVERSTGNVTQKAPDAD